MVGQLAAKPPRVGNNVRGLLVSKGRDNTLLHPDDLPTYTRLYRGQVTQKQVCKGEVGGRQKQAL